MDFNRGIGALSQQEIDQLLAGGTGKHTCKLHGIEEVNMGGKNIVVTVYGQNRTIDKISVCIFDELSYSSSYTDNYCNTINSLDLKGNAWVYAKKIEANCPYSLDSFLPIKFSDEILKLDDKAIQLVLRKVDSQTLSKALKSVDASVRDAIFKNMSKRAVAMLKEDMEYMGPIRIKDVLESQENILEIIFSLEKLDK
jgi:hypothetical protein